MKIKSLKENINNIINEDYNMNSLIGELSDEELLKFCSDIDINIPDGEMEIATGYRDRDGDYPYEDFPIKFKYEPLFIEHYEDEVDWRIITLNVHGECCGYYDDYEVEIEDVDPSMTLNQFQEILKKNLVDAANQLEHDGLENGEYNDGSDYWDDMDESLLKESNNKSEYEKAYDDLFDIFTSYIWSFADIDVNKLTSTSMDVITEFGRLYLKFFNDRVILSWTDYHDNSKNFKIVGDNWEDIKSNKKFKFFTDINYRIEPFNESLLKESYDTTTVEDMLDRQIGNMSDEEIDRDLKIFNKIKRVFGLKRIEDIYVVVSDGEEAPQHYDDYFNWDIIPLTKDGLVRYISEDNNIDMIIEELNNNYYLYFKYESEANRYLKMIEGINNGEPTDESLTENYDKEFLDKYNPVVDITNKKRYTYKKYDNKEFVYDNENALLIWVYKDEDEINELGKANTPYRELDAIGLSRDNWEESPEYWLEQYVNELDEMTSFETHHNVNISKETSKTNPFNWYDGPINGTIEEFNPTEFVNKVKERKRNLHTVRTANDGLVYTIFLDYPMFAHDISEEYPGWIDIVSEDKNGKQVRTFIEKVTSWDEAISKLDEQKKIISSK